MARDLAVDDTLTDDQPTADDAPMDAFGNEFEDAAASALDDSQDDVANPGDDVVEGDLEPLEDTDTPETPPIGVDRGDGRDATGKFATKAEQDAADAKAQAETTAPTAAPAAPVVEQAAPVFEPLVVRADKTLHPIDEAQVTRANGYHVITIKDEDAPRFMQRMSKGIVGEKIWRDLQTGIKELEQERAAPQAKTDSQIEAEIILATIKDRLGTSSWKSSSPSATTRTPTRRNARSSSPRRPRRSSRHRPPRSSSAPSWKASPTRSSISGRRRTTCADSVTRRSSRHSTNSKPSPAPPTGRKQTASGTWISD
jgi:hypothetical protein